jgi:hypothetical protein
MKKRLLRYENSNSHPSKNSVMSRKIKRMKERRKREEESNGSEDSATVL